MCSMTISVFAVGCCVLVDEVISTRCSAAKLRMGFKNACIDDKDSDTTTVDIVVVCRVKRQITLVDAIETPFSVRLARIHLNNKVLTVSKIKYTLLGLEARPQE